MPSASKARLGKGVKADAIRLVHRVVGSKHVITSPDVPELHVSHASETIARADVQPALDALQREKDRLAAKKEQARMSRVA